MANEKKNSKNPLMTKGTGKSLAEMVAAISRSSLLSGIENTTISLCVPSAGSHLNRPFLLFLTLSHIIDKPTKFSLSRAYSSARQARSRSTARRSRREICTCETCSTRAQFCWVMPW